MLTTSQTLRQSGYSSVVVEAGVLHAVDNREVDYYATGCLYDNREVDYCATGCLYVLNVSNLKNKTINKEGK